MPVPVPGPCVRVRTEALTAKARNRTLSFGQWRLAQVITSSYLIAHVNSIVHGNGIGIGRLRFLQQHTSIQYPQMLKPSYS